MSKLTEVLKLLCYDPETDGNLTFNVTEALTKNWEKIDAALAPLGGATTPQAVIAALGAGVRPNLLDNAIFVGGGTADNLPVNQKSQTSYSGAAGFCIDRWYRFVDANISLLSNGIVFNAGSENNLLEQKIAKNLTGYKVTMSAIVDDNLYAGTKIVDTLDYTNTVEIPEGSLRVFYDGNNTIFRLWFDSMNQHTVKAVKLEYGDNQTLAYHDSDGAWHLLQRPESDYATQLSKCQRYQIPLVSYQPAPSQIAANSIGFFIPLPTTMRTTPVISQNNLQIQDNTGSPVSGFTFTVASLRPNGVYINANKTAHGLQTAWLYAGFGENASMLSSNL